MLRLNTSRSSGELDLNLWLYWNLDQIMTWTCLLERLDPNLDSWSTGFQKPAKIRSILRLPVLKYMSFCWENQNQEWPHNPKCYKILNSGFGQFFDFFWINMIASNILRQQKWSPTLGAQFPFLEIFSHDHMFSLDTTFLHKIEYFIIIWKPETWENWIGIYGSLWSASPGF